MFYQMQLKEHLYTDLFFFNFYLETLTLFLKNLKLFKDLTNSFYILQLDNIYKIPISQFIARTMKCISYKQTLSTSLSKTDLYNISKSAYFTSKPKHCVN